MLNVPEIRIVVPTPKLVATTSNRTVTVESTIEFMPPEVAGAPTAPEVVDTLFKKLNDAASNRVAIGSEFKLVSQVNLAGETNAGWRRCRTQDPCANGEFVESQDQCETNVRDKVAFAGFLVGGLSVVVVAALFLRALCKGGHPEWVTAVAAMISMADTATDAIVVAGYFDIKAKVPYAWIVGAFLMCVVAFTNLALFVSFYAQVLCRRRSGGASVTTVGGSASVNGRERHAVAQQLEQDTTPGCCYRVQFQQPHDPAFEQHYRQQRKTFAIVAVLTFLFGFGWSSVLYSRAAEWFMPRFEKPNHHIGTCASTNVSQLAYRHALMQLASCEFGLRLRRSRPWWKICHN